jgi:Basic region leucine zipper
MLGLECSHSFLWHSRERNRQHAKMTRHRKKCFVATLEQAILDLERELASLRSRVNSNSSSSNQTTTARSMVTPELSSVPSPPLDVVPSSCLVETFHDVSKRSGDSLYNDDDDDSPTNKRVCRHGFLLDSC